MSAPRDPAAARYQGISGRHYQESKRALPSAAFDWVSRARSRLFAPHVRPDDTVLEMGVGFGWNLAGLRCRRRIGLDLTESLRGECEERGIEFFVSAESLPDHTADVVICHHMLEHAGHPGAVLEELHRLVSPDGALLLAVPYEREWRYRRYDASEPNHHLYSWNVQTLGALVETHDFKVTEAGLRRYGQDRIAARIAVRFGLGERSFRALRAVGRSLRRQLEIAVVARPVQRRPASVGQPSARNG